MIAKLLKARRSRNARRRKSFRPFAEPLEKRLLLANGFVAIEFDTALESLDLSGGPFPLPLASDPTNSLPGLPASVDGYGFVDSTVTVTLSSQRPVDPGPDTQGKACAFLFDDYGGESAALNVGEQGCQREDPTGQSGPLDPIDPEQLDGREFFVDSFFDVFFDITVTDVDDRPGRDYAGQEDGASIVLQDQGPGFLQSFYYAQFNKDAPNFGLVPPPPEASRPYVGHFDIVIPLPGDVNGNDVTPDYLKFTLASHLAGAATFIQLPDGTVVDQFDSTATILGAVSDDLADPPFHIGEVLDPDNCTPGAPSNPDEPDPCSPVAGTGLSGPTTATSTLLNSISGVDLSINKDAEFDPETGTLVYTVSVTNFGGTDATNVVVTDTLPAGTTYLSDTDSCVEGPAGTLTCSLGAIAAGGTASFDVTVSVDEGAPEVLTNTVSVTSDAVSDPSWNNEFSLDTSLKLKDPGASYVDANNDQLFSAADGDVLLTNGELDNGIFNTLRPEGGYTTVIDGAGLVITGPPIIAGNIRLAAEGDLVINTHLTSTGRLGGTAGGNIILRSLDGSVLLDDPTLSALVDIRIRAEGDITSTDDVLQADRNVELRAGDAVVLHDTVVTAGQEIDIAGDSVDVSGSLLSALNELVIRARTADLWAIGANLAASQNVELRARESIFAALATITAGQHVEIHSGEDVDLTGATVVAGKKIEIDADDTLNLNDATLTAGVVIDLEACVFVENLATNLTAPSVNRRTSC